MNDKLLTILVTGAKGQLGKELKVLDPKFPYCQFFFVSKDELNIADKKALDKFFAGHSIDFCVNCAAYTAVDKAESEKDLAFKINADAVATLAAVCHKNNTQLIHISTDYVFDGTSKQPYTENDKTATINIYGASKLKGEELAIENCPSTIIIRTAWLYSSFNSNFVNTMLRLMKEKESINVVNDQFGCPTYAADLALAIMRIIKSNKSRENAGIYHYSNSEITSWYDFAVAIKELSNSNCTVNPITTAEYPTAAKRPVYSVLNTEKITSTFETVDVRNWKDGLRSCLAAV